MSRLASVHCHCRPALESRAGPQKRTAACLPLNTVFTVAKYDPMGTTIMASVKASSLRMTSLFGPATFSSRPSWLGVCEGRGREYSRGDRGRCAARLLLVVVCGSRRVIPVQDSLLGRDDAAGCHGGRYAGPRWTGTVIAGSVR